MTEVHQVSNKDLNAVATFLDSAAFVHRHLDWRNTLEWLDDKPFLVLTENDLINAVLAIPPDPPGIAWVRCLATNKSYDLESAWRILFPYAKTFLDSQKAEVYAVGLEEWFCRLLDNQGFQIKQRIVVLSWDHHIHSIPSLPQEILIRPMEYSDLEAVTDVDRQSFEPLWVNSGLALRSAYLQSEHASVAEISGKIIAYELSTANQYAAHLARLAVLPTFQRQSIGINLAREMLLYFSHRGVMQVTVNTQKDNLSSLALYQSLGFKPTFEEYPVYSI